MRGRIILSIAVIAIIAATACTRKHSLYIDPGKREARPAARF